MRPKKIVTEFAVGFLFLLVGIVPAQQTAPVWQRMFMENATPSLLPDFTDAYGVVFRDLNRDGQPDLYFVRFRNLNRLFLNQSAGSGFEDFTIRSGLGGNLMPRGQENLELGAAAADWDNDGWPDMLLAGWGVSTRFFHQHRDGSFVDQSPAGMHLPPLDANGGFWADVNLDGKLDAFLTDEHHPNRLLLGDGKNGFRDVSGQWGISDTTVSQGAAFTDVDGDGYPDLYVCNWFAPDVFYRNQGGGSFSPQPLQLFHLRMPVNTNGVSFGDIDNDGDPDMLVTDRDRLTRLYRNDTTPDSGGWHFTDITRKAGIQLSFPAYGSVIADFDQDGWQDIWVNCIGPNALFHNTGTGQFEKVFEERHPFWHPKKFYSTGAATADVDADGDLDLVVANKDTNSVLYINPVNNSAWLQVALEGVRANRDAIGAKVWLYAAGKIGADSLLIGYREVSGGGGYLSQNTPMVHFGVRPAGRYDLKIWFPGGRYRELRNVEAGQIYRIAEYDGLARWIFRMGSLTGRIISAPRFQLNFLLLILLFGTVSGYTFLAISRYRWGARQVTTFLVFCLILLYGLFLVLQQVPLFQRLVIQLLLIAAVLLFLSLFAEKIRRLELKRLEYRRLLRDLSSELIFIKDNQKIYQKLVTTVFDTVHPRFCLLYCGQEEKLLLRAGAGTHPLSEEIEIPAAADQPVADRVQALSGTALPSDCLIFPLQRGPSLLGILVLAPPESGRRFSPDDRQIFQVLAGQAAVAMENNRYIEESKELIRRVTEAETREKYVRELEEKNATLQRLYRDLKATQAQLIQSEKMAGLGQLVAGIAHELNNPISYVYANMKELQSYLSVIRRLVEIGAGSSSPGDIENRLTELRREVDLNFVLQDVDSMITESLEGSRRVKDIVLNLRNFSRLDEAELKKADLHQGLESTLQLLKNETCDRIQVHRDYGDLPLVVCHPGHLNQVFMNLLVNAVQAIEGKGNIHIRTRHINEWVLIEISDDGKGIPPEIQSKIFDPFFTSKPVGRGTGLGLSISYQIVQNHHGTLEVESTPEKGSLFRIKLPVKGDAEKGKNQKGK